MFEQDVFIKRCKRKVESMNEEDLWLDGSFMSEADMKEANIKEFFCCNSILWNMLAISFLPLLNGIVLQSTLYPGF